ncbi:hypothetical protein GCM10010300_70670 [Streptomyces olivaceoviridis]|nr:hypothetical protein GCM10010300_70670 [Streptomyces olivaceoviridis]
MCGDRSGSLAGALGGRGRRTPRGIDRVQGYPAGQRVKDDDAWRRPRSVPHPATAAREPPRAPPPAKRKDFPPCTEQ